MTKIKQLSFLALILFLNPCYAIIYADKVIVNKTEATLYLEKAGKTFNTFKVVFGSNPQGHKQKEGDERTPEGRHTSHSHRCGFLSVDFCR